MSQARPVNLPDLRRRYDEVRAMQNAVRGLLQKLTHEDMKKSPWPSGRNLWGTLQWWVVYRRPFLNVVEGLPHEKTGLKDQQPRGFSYADTWKEWDECTARADEIMKTFSEERWNSEVDFWASPKMERKIRAWEFFQTHFANRLDMEWTLLLEDICTMGHQKWLEKLIGNDWNHYREGEKLTDFHPNQA